MAGPLTARVMTRSGARWPGSFAQLEAYVERFEAARTVRYAPALRGPLPAWQQMDQVASRAHERTKNPAYHFVLSWRDQGNSDEQISAAVDMALEKLGVRDHQWIAARHADAEHDHVHVLVNRVHPASAKTWSPSFDHLRLRSATRELGGAIDRKTGTVRGGAADFETWKGQESMQTWARELVRPAIERKLDRMRSWSALHEALAEHGLSLELEYRRKALEAIVVDQTGRRRRAMRAIAVSPLLSIADLERRLGPFEPPPPTLSPNRARGYGFLQSRLLLPSAWVARDPAMRELYLEYVADQVSWNNAGLAAADLERRRIKAEFRAKHDALKADLAAAYPIVRDHSIARDVMAALGSSEIMELRAEKHERLDAIADRKPAGRFRTWLKRREKLGDNRARVALLALRKVDVMERDLPQRTRLDTKISTVELRLEIAIKTGRDRKTDNFVPNEGQQFDLMGARYQRDEQRILMLERDGDRFVPARAVAIDNQMIESWMELQLLQRERATRQLDGRSGAAAHAAGTVAENDRVVALSGSIERPREPALPQDLALAQDAATAEHAGAVPEIAAPASEERHAPTAGETQSNAAEQTTLHHASGERAAIVPEKPVRSPFAGSISGRNPQPAGATLVFAKDQERTEADARYRREYGAYLAELAPAYTRQQAAHAARLASLAEARDREIEEARERAAQNPSAEQFERDLDYIRIRHLRAQGIAEDSFDLEASVVQHLSGDRRPMTYREFLVAAATAQSLALAKAEQGRMPVVEHAALLARASVETQAHGNAVSVDGRDACLDRGAQIDVFDARDKEAARVALLIAAAKFDGQVTLNGEHAYKVAMLELAVEMGVTVTNLELENEQHRLRQECAAQNTEASRRDVPTIGLTERPPVENEADAAARIDAAVRDVVEARFAKVPSDWTDGASAKLVATLEFAKRAYVVGASNGALLLAEVDREAAARNARRAGESLELSAFGAVERRHRQQRSR